MPVNAVHIVMVRYGIPDDGRFEMPPSHLLDDIDGLCDYCRSIRRQASTAIYALDRAIDYVSMGPCLPIAPESAHIRGLRFA